MSMADSKPFLRRLEVKVGAGGDLLSIVSNGTPEGLKVTCAIQKTVMGQPNPSTVSIWNLSDASRTNIQKSLSQITVLAGWENSGMHTVLTGNVMSCLSERSGPDIVTKLTVVPGYKAIIKGTVSKTYGPNMPLVDVVKDLGSFLPDITVSDSTIKGVTGTLGAGGWSFAGSTRDALTKLANEFGFSWTIDGDALRIIGDKSIFDGVVVLEGDNGGLINVSPILSGPLQKQTGVKIKAIYVPGIEPGKTVQVKSSLSQGLDGNYRIHTASFALDTFSDGWTMDIESFRNQ